MLTATSNEDWQSAVLSGRFTPVSWHRPDASAAWQSFFERAFDRLAVAGPIRFAHSGRSWNAPCSDRVLRVAVSVSLGYELFQLFYTFFQLC